MAIVTHLTVSNTPIIQNLEQHIENVAMGLFHFIKQHHGIWTTAHLQEMSEVCVRVKCRGLFRAAAAGGVERQKQHQQVEGQDCGAEAGTDGTAKAETTTGLGGAKADA